MAAPPLSSAIRASIERFVRGTLGCRCPDEVFEAIVIERAHAPDHASRYTRLVVGDRLLIYIVQDTDALAVQRLTSKGLAERNDNGYNRFRLVIGCGDPAQVQGEIEMGFAGVAGADDRAHLHLIAADAVPHGLRP